MEIHRRKQKATANYGRAGKLIERNVNGAARFLNRVLLPAVGRISLIDQSVPVGIRTAVVVAGGHN